MTIDVNGFSTYRPVSFKSTASGNAIVVPAEAIREVVVATNRFLRDLGVMFKELDVNLFEILGQRNLSGFVGEVFSHHFGQMVPGFASNPHPDGRPDILDVSAPEALAAFKVGARAEQKGDATAIRAAFNPFPYGGVEVKCTIGDPASNHKKRLLAEHNLNQFPVGLSRVSYLRGITYWGHHTSCSNLLGLYYDYCDELGGTPQIMAVMHAEFDADGDWHPLSVGRADSKKTSNTSITRQAKAKILSGLVVIRNHEVYRNALVAIGVTLQVPPTTKSR